jgi:hypothetical protein
VCDVEEGPALGGGGGGVSPKSHGATPRQGATPRRGSGLTALPPPPLDASGSHIHHSDANTASVRLSPAAEEAYDESSLQTDGIVSVPTHAPCTRKRAKPPRRCPLPR